jgi:general secretion pathway protein K
MILVIVLWMMTLLSLLAGSFAYSRRTDMRSAAYGVERAQARALAEAGLAYAVMHLLATGKHGPSGSDWPVDGSVREWRFGQGQLRIAAIDAAGLIDLNSADRGLLRSFFAAAGVQGGQLESLVDAIEDWRDPDDLRRLHGAESEEYRAGGRTAGAKNAAFESVEDLQQVLGMTRELYDRVASGLTVYSGETGINPAFAPAAVLKSLPGVDQRVVEDYLRRRAENTLQGLPPPSPVTGPYLVQGGGKAYHVNIEAQTASGVAAFLETVVSPPNSPKSLYRILAWQEDK